MANSQSTPDIETQIAELVQEITGGWPHVIEVWEEFRLRHRYYLRADLEADRDEFLKQALWLALGRKQLRSLINRFNERGLASPDIGTATAAVMGSGFSLQSYVNGSWQPQDALAGGRRFMEACDHVCRIAISGQHRGTGFLLRPTIVATAAHVVKPLLDPDNAPIAGALGKLSLTFLDSDGLLDDEGGPEADPILAQLNEDWLGYLSPPADGEGTDHYAIDCIEGIDSESGPWDLALIRLAQPPRLGLKGYQLLAENPPEPCFGVHLLHHPADALGAPMGLLWSIGEIKQRLGDPRALRWLHDANTDSGSSGAPCFDNGWRLVGLHQAGQAAVSTAAQSNRAVPIYPWAGGLDRIAAHVDVTPYVDSVSGAAGQDQPVFGRRDFQMRAWRAMMNPLPEEQRVFLVLGDSGTGKTYTSAILTELARKAGCRVAAFDALNAQSDTPVDFARRIVGALGGSLPDTSDWLGLTTEARDMRNDVMPLLAQELERIAGKQSLWLVLDRLEVCDTAVNGLGQLIEGLVATLENMPYLHLVLLGWKGTLRTESAEVLPPGPLVEDIVTYLLQRLAPPGYTADAHLFEVLRSIVQSKFDGQVEIDLFERATATVVAIEAVVKSLLAALPATEGPEGASKT